MVGGARLLPLYVTDGRGSGDVSVVNRCLHRVPPLVSPVNAGGVISAKRRARKMLHL